MQMLTACPHSARFRSCGAGRDTEHLHFSSQQQQQEIQLPLCVTTDVAPKCGRMRSAQSANPIGVVSGWPSWFWATLQSPSAPPIRWKPRRAIMLAERHDTQDCESETPQQHLPHRVQGVPASTSPGSEGDVHKEKRVRLGEGHPISRQRQRLCGSRVQEDIPAHPASNVLCHPPHLAPAGIPSP